MKRIRDDLAYVLPFAAFMLCLWVGSKWKSLYPASYVARVVLTGALLVICWPSYTKVRWNGWWLGVIVGVVGTFQWIGMQLWLQNHSEFFKPSPEVFNPFEIFHSPAAVWSFIVVRMIGAVIVVPVMEELFWRDFLWREVIAPNDFKLAQVGEFEWPAVLISTGAFASVHGNWWLTAVGWGLMVAALLIYTKSLGACIIAHATTNLLLGLWVLKTGEWSFW